MAMRPIKPSDVPCLKCGRLFQSEGTKKLHDRSKACARRQLRNLHYGAGWAPARHARGACVRAGIALMVDPASGTSRSESTWAPAWAVLVYAAADQGWKRQPGFAHSIVACLKRVEALGPAVHACIESLARMRGPNAVATFVGWKNRVKWERGGWDPYWWLDEQDERR